MQGSRLRSSPKALPTMLEESEVLSDDSEWLTNVVSNLDWNESEAEKLYQPFARLKALQPERRSMEPIYATYPSPPPSSSSFKHIQSPSSVPASTASFQSHFSKQSTASPVATMPRSKASSNPPLSPSPSSPGHSPTQSMHRPRSATEGSAHGSIMSMQTSASSRIARAATTPTAQPGIEIVLTSDRTSVAAGTLEGFVHVMISSRTCKFRRAQSGTKSLMPPIHSCLSNLSTEVPPLLSRFRKR